MSRSLSASQARALAAELGALVQINFFFCCGDESPTRPGGGGTTPDGPSARDMAKALRFTIKILMENLDTQTVLRTVIRVGAEVIADQVVMHGEKAEFFIGNAEVLFNRQVDIESEIMTFEMVHPGIPSNEQPHVRLQVTDLALVMADDSVHAASINMEESSIFTDKHHEDYPPGHWNFVDGNRSSGQVLIHVA
ncbi:MAG TPA: hypothetical protein VID27_11650 [Blastocatellia bacterium]